MAETELTKVEYKPLNMKEAVEALFNNQVLIVKGLEQRKRADILVRLNQKGRIPVTQVSYDITPPDGYWRDQYWIIFDLPMNVLSTYPCYVYSEDLAKGNPKYVEGQTVYYTSKEDNQVDSALVLGVYTDEDHNWYYRLSRDKEYYKEAELSKESL